MNPVTIRGVGPRPCPVAIYAIAPSRLDNNFGRPFTGDAGAVLNLLLNWFGMVRHRTFMSFIVKQWPGEGVEPRITLRDIQKVEQELEEVEPRLIIALGAEAARFFMDDPDLDMDLVNGIPHRVDGRVIIPCFHPAVALSNDSLALKLWLGIKAAAEYVADADPARIWTPNPRTVHVTRVRLREPEIITRPAAIDTEGTPGHPYSIQYSRNPDEAVVVSADDAKWLDFRGQCIFHNAKYDVRMCREMGVQLPPASLWEDTMVMAYCRQDLPHGLKALSYRLLRRHMTSFEETVRKHFNPVALDYLETVALVKGWTRPAEALVEDKTTGRLKTYRPNATDARAKSILTTYAKDPNADINDLWFNITKEQRDEVEETLGSFPRFGIEAVPQREADQYGGTDAASTLELHRSIGRGDGVERTSAIYRQDVLCLPALVEIESTGLPFSPDASRSLSIRFQSEAETVRDEMREISGYETLNPGSVKQISQILFKDWGIKSPRKTKLTGNDSSDDRALSTLALQFAERKGVEKISRFIFLLQEYRELRKMDGTYARALPPRVKAGRVHPRINNTQVVSGRLSSSDPNLQNIPSRSERGRLIRGCFIAPRGSMLLSVDYSQIELRILAHESGDPALIEAFTGSEDLHRKTEKYIFGVPDEEAGKKRTAAKTFNFRIAYAGPNGSPKGLQEQLFLDGITLSVQACADYRDRWFGMYPDVARFLRLAGDEARRNGYAETSGGRRRYLPFARLAEVPRVRAESERQAGNLKIQGASQEVIKAAMVRWDQKGSAGANKIVPTKLCMQIHDELLFEVATVDPILLKRVSRYLVDLMLEETSHFKVPILAEAKAGRDWGSQEKVKLT